MQSTFDSPKDGPVFQPDFHLCDHLIDARIREGLSDRIAITEDVAGVQRHVTYGSLAENMRRAASALVRGGVRSEERVLLALPDSIAFATALFGTLHAGAVVTMANPELPTADFAHYLDYTRARAIVLSGELFDRLTEVLSTARHLRLILVVAPSGKSALPPELAAITYSFESALDDADPDFVRAPVGRDDVAMWLFTSGSTGKPKGAVHLHQDFAYNIETYAKQVLLFAERDVTLAAPKLFFGYATGTNLFFPLSVGARTVLFPERSTPARLFELIEQHKPTVLTSVPTIIAKMVAEDPDGKRDLKSLRVSISAGEALPEELYHRWIRTYGGEILDGIGSAEMFHIYISNRFGEVVPGSLGKLVPGYSARIVGAAGEEVADGEVGTLWICGDSAAICYFGDHAKSKQVLRGDWVVTGDQMRRDSDGRFWYAGRADDLLKVSGIWVAPQEIESVLTQHSGVLECAATGFEQEGLTRIVVYVVPKADGASDFLRDELFQLAKARLAHHKVPRRIEFVSAIPRSDRGKIARRELAALSVE